MKIAFIGAGVFQLPGIRLAKESGHQVFVFSWEPDRKNVQDICDIFFPISVTDKENILLKCQEIEINGVMSICSDLCEITANFVAEKMRLPGHNSMEVVKFSTNKFLMREKFAKNKVSSPLFFLVKSPEDLKKAIERTTTQNLILKPTDRSGSRGIFKFDRNSDDQNISKIFQESSKESFAQECILEEFVEGDEFSVETFSINGQHNIISITQKTTTGSPNYIETGHIQPPLNLTPRGLEDISKVALSSLTALNITNGPSHIELKYDGFVCKIIEVGPRMGGDFIGTHLTKISSGFDFLQATIDQKLGILRNFESYSSSTKSYAFASFGISPAEGKIKRFFMKDIDGVNILEKDFPTYSKAKTTDSTNRIGHVIGQAEKISKEQDILLEVVIE